MNGELNEFSLEQLEALFNEDIESATPPTEEVVETPSTEEVKSDTTTVDNTKAFSERLKKSTAKAVQEERENIAKQMGYTSYEEMIKSKEAKLIEDSGLDPEQVNPVVEQLVKQRLDNDPRLKELETLRAQKVKEFAKQELAEISKLTDGEITKLEDIPKEVVELWKTKGSLKSAYLELKGEELITKMKSKQSKGSTSHMQNLSGTAPAQGNKRLLTAEEKSYWKYFNPGMTDEELNKKTIDI